MTDFKFSVWLGSIFIRNIKITDRNDVRGQEAAKRQLTYLYPKKYMLLKIKK